MTLSNFNITKTRPADITLLLVLVLAPFFKGLYYEQQMLAFQAAVFMAFLFFLVQHRSLTYKHSMDYAAAVFAIGYLFSIPGAADTREALLSFMRVLAGLMIYMIISFRARDSVFRQKALTTIYLSGVVASIGILLNLTGHIETARVWESGIIQTTFEYKNAGALFLLVCIMLGVYLINNSINLKRSILFSCINFANILFLLGTQSRTVWLLSPLCLLTVIWGFPRISRIPALVQTIITAVPALAVSGQVISSLNDGNTGQAIVLLFLGMIIAGTAVFLWQQWGTQLISAKVWVVMGAAVCLILAAGLFAAAGDTSIGEKLHNIANFDFNAQERLVFFRDAFKIFTRHPIFGAGGKGWDVLYLNIQSYGYYAENVHNDLLQIAVESGLIGALAFLSLWTAFFLVCLRSLWHNTDTAHRQTVHLLIGIGTALFLHFLFDFDLAHGAIAFIMWTIFGLARSYADPESSREALAIRNQGTSLKFPLYVSIIAAGILYSLVSLSFFTGGLWFSYGEKVLKTGNLTATGQAFEKSLAFDPWKANTLLSLAQVNLALYQNNRDPSALEKALSYAAKSIALRPAEPLTRSVYSTALFYKGDYPGSVQEALNFTKLHPMLQESYEQLAYTNLISGLALTKKGGKGKGSPYFENALGVKDMINARLKVISPYHLEMWNKNQAKPVLSVSPLIKIYTGIASLCLDNAPQGLQLIQEGLIQAPSSSQVQIWNILALRLQGKEKESQALLNRVSARNPGFVQVYNDILAIAAKH